MGSNGGETTQTDTAGLSTSLATLWATQAYGDTDVGRLAEVAAPAAAFTTTSGISGHVTRADVTGGCGDQVSSVWTFAFPAPDLVGLYAVIILSDGAPGSVTDEQAMAMLSSVRESAVPPELAEGN